MSSPESVKAVVTALLGNTFVTVIKFVAFLLSGSGAMLSEAIHSAADTGNQILLLIGLKRAGREADDRFHYGYGGERFVFGMLSAAGIFFLGCGVTVYHGVTSLLAPHMPQFTYVTFVVLGLAFVIEGSVLLVAVRSINRQRGGIPFRQFVRERADPATVAILLEDGAAVLGLVIAAFGILLSYMTDLPWFDAIGSIVVGLLLGVIAWYLVRANRELLLGRAVPEGVEELFVETVLRQPVVRSVRDVKTRQITPEEYHFKAEITLDNDYLAGHLEQALPRLQVALDGARRARTSGRLAALATSVIATEIIAIERAIRATIPLAEFIDLEIAHPDQPLESGEYEATKEDLETSERSTE